MIIAVLLYYAAEFLGKEETKNRPVYNYGFCIGNEGVTEEWLNSVMK